MDWNDSNKLSEQSNTTIRLANEYRTIRKKWANAKLYLDCLLALRYKEGKVERSISLEKAYITLVEQSILPDGQQSIAEAAYVEFVQLEADYKGLERVLEANQNHIILAQSLLKNKARET